VEYDSSRSRADQRFKEKRFLVTGKVLWRSSERPVLKLEVGEKAKYAAVQATFVSVEQLPAVGETVALRCTCRGYFAMVLMDQCLVETAR